MTTYPARGADDAVLLPHCGSCGRWAWPENSMFCPSCGGLLEPASAPRGGVLLSAVVVRAGVLPVHLADGAYPLGLLQLDDGPLFVTRLESDPDDLPPPGTRVRLVWGMSATGQEWPIAESDPSTRATLDNPTRRRQWHTTDGRQVSA